MRHEFHDEFRARIFIEACDFCHFSMFTQDIIPFRESCEKFKCIFTPSLTPYWCGSNCLCLSYSYFIARGFSIPWVFFVRCLYLLLPEGGIETDEKFGIVPSLSWWTGNRGCLSNSGNDVTVCLNVVALLTVRFIYQTNSVIGTIVVLLPRSIITLYVMH
jgi:hypothetical protein